jgi:DNA helicase II / ATP-dependent DNA helicase PcrA
VSGADLRNTPAMRAALNGYAPTDEQWDAISHPLDPAYLVAGAGSGKTAVMAARIVWTIEAADFDPGQILGLTFTNKAAEELQDRVRRALAQTETHRPEDITVQTYHSFASGVVKEHGLLVGVEPEAGLLSDAQQWQLVLSCIDDLPPFEHIELRSPAGIVRATLDLASSISDHIVSVNDIIAADERILASREASEEMRETAYKRIELCRAVDAYTRAKRAAQRIDFGDQVVKAVEILEGFDDVRGAYQQRYPVLLLDEYQDTNVAQRRMVESLVGDRGTITAVGDARQAIYGWRGATMYNLIGFPGHFPKPDGSNDYRHIPLSENFRSGKRILDVANAVVSRIDPERRPGDDLRPHGDNGEGTVGLGLFADELAEARSIADEIERLHGVPTMDGRDPVSWRDIAILVRRKATIDAIYEELKARDIPVEAVGLTGLLRMPEIVELVAWLRVLEGRPSANRWLARILLGPRWRIHFRDLALLAGWEARQNHDLRLMLAGGDAEVARELAPGEVGVSLTEALENIADIEHLGPRATERLASFRERLSALQKVSSGPLLDMVQEVIVRSGVGDAIDASRSRSAPAARQNLSNFLDHVAAFAPVEGEASLRSFLAYLDAADEAEETLEAVQPAGSDSVKLMTVHSAKGLEFECVFVPSVAASEGKSGKVWSIFPDTRASNPLTSYRMLPYDVREDRGHLPRFSGKLKEFHEAVKERAAEDERRLFYVALTRAKQRLYVTAAWWYGRADREKGPSEFWDELEQLCDDGLIDLIEKADQPAENPIVESLKGAVTWPPEARAGLDDPFFAEGVGPAADALVSGSASIDDLVARLSEGERASYETLLARAVEELAVIEAATASQPRHREPVVPNILSATSHVALQSGRSTAWELARPLPQRPTRARRIGTEVHRLIEEWSRGMAPYPEETELDEPGEAVTDPSPIFEMLDRLKDRYRGRRIARLPSGEPMVELPFVLRKDGRIIRGRIDAVYEIEDGGLEIVDYKTGMRFEPGEHDQLALYAEAMAANGLLPPDAPVTLTYAFLDGGEPASRVWLAPATGED